MTEKELLCGIAGTGVGIFVCAMVVPSWICTAIFSLIGITITAFGVLIAEDI